MKPKRKKSWLVKDIPTGSAQDEGLETEGGNPPDEDILSSEDEEAQIHIIKGLDTRGLYVEAGKGAENGGGDDDELDSDEDWDTSEWGKEDVESACMALLDEIEKATDPKMHRMATMMLSLHQARHSCRLPRWGNGALLDKRSGCSTMASPSSRNLTLLLSKVVHSLGDVSQLFVKASCTNAFGSCAPVVQLRFRFRRYLNGRENADYARTPQQMIMLQRIVDQQAKFREVRLSPNGGEIPDENCHIEPSAT